jgi:hypothetical protein
MEPLNEWKSINHNGTTQKVTMELSNRVLRHIGIEIFFIMAPRPYPNQEDSWACEHFCKAMTSYQDYKSRRLEL